MHVVPLFMLLPGRCLRCVKPELCVMLCFCRATKSSGDIPDVFFFFFLGEV